MKNKIFTLVGPSGAGKSTLIVAAACELQDRLEIIKSVTTRPRREEKDDLFYLFISAERFEPKKQRGEFVETVKYAGNFYAYERNVVDAMLAKKHGICAATEHGIIALMRSGYHVRAIKIIPKYQSETRNAKRKKADKERSKLHITYQKEIVNSFQPGGKEKAIKELIEYIKNSILERRM